MEKKIQFAENQFLRAVKKWKWLKIRLLGTGFFNVCFVLGSIMNHKGNIFKNFLIKRG